MENSNGTKPMGVTEEDGKTKGLRNENDDTFFTLLRRLIADIFLPDQNNKATSFFHRLKISVSENGPIIGEASRNAGRDLLRWTRRGSPLRALLVISVGTVAVLTMTGLLVFMLFFLTATLNAIIISLFISLAVAGGFLALFFACVTAIYIGALSVSAFVISTATISAIVAVLVVTGWIGFFYMVGLAIRKSLRLAKHSLTASGSAISAFSSARRSNKD